MHFLASGCLKLSVWADGRVLWFKAVVGLFLRLGLLPAGLGTDSVFGKNNSIRNFEEIMSFL